jgi:hypothetical protein
MSGGAAVKAGGGVEGDHPVCTTAAPPKPTAKAAMNKKCGGRPGIRPAPPFKGLGLDSSGAAGPFFKKTRAMHAGPQAKPAPDQKSC